MASLVPLLLGRPAFECAARRSKRHVPADALIRFRECELDVSTALALACLLHGPSASARPQAARHRQHSIRCDQMQSDEIRCSTFKAVPGGGVHVARAIIEPLPHHRGAHDHQGSSGIIRDHQGSSGIIRDHQGSSGINRDHQGSTGIIRDHQGSLELIRRAIMGGRT